MSEPAQNTGDERGPLWRPRGGNGRWRPDITTIERDRRCAELASQGMTMQDIADTMGYESRNGAHQAVRRAWHRAAIEDGTLEELRRQQLEELRLVRVRAHELLNSPPPAISRTGKVVVDANGEPIPDATIILGALAMITKANERTARLTGTEAARRSVSITGHANATVAEIRACMAQWNPATVRQALEEAGAELQAKTAIEATAEHLDNAD